MKSPRDLAQDTDPLLMQLRGLIRRFAITLSGAKAIWQLAGFKLADGTQETKQAEVFSGIGFYAIPPSSGNPEAIGAMVGDARVPIAIATRDEKTRAAVAGNLQAGETMAYNAVAVVYLKSDGTVEIRAPGGAAVPLATKADVQAIATYLQKQFDHTAGHVHATPSGLSTGITEGAGSIPPTGSAPNPSGTTVLKGE